MYLFSDSCPKEKRESYILKIHISLDLWIHLEGGLCRVTTHFQILVNEHKFYLWIQESEQTFPKKNLASQKDEMFL